MKKIEMKTLPAVPTAPLFRKCLVNPEDSSTLESAQQSHRIIAVIEEAGEKLGFLGSITTNVLQQRDELSKFVGDEISRIIQEQRTLEGKYEKLIEQRSALKGLANKSRYKEIQAEIQFVSRALRDSTRKLCRNLKENPDIGGNLLKVQRERADLIDLLNTTCNEVAKTESFPTLAGMVEDDRLARSRQSELVRREREATQAVKKLEADLFAERADHSRQVTESKAKLSELKQTLVAVKSKTSVDIRYSRKEHRARVSTLLRVYEQYERQLEGQVKELERLREVEAVVHAQTMGFLKKKRRQLQDQVDAWEEKYTDEVGALEQTCEELVNRRNAMLEALEGLKRRKRQDEQDEQAREEARKRALLEEQERTDTERRQHDAAIKIQRVMREFLKQQIANKAKKGKKGGGKKKKKGKK